MQVSPWVGHRNPFVMCLAVIFLFCLVHMKMYRSIMLGIFRKLRALTITYLNPYFTVIWLTHAHWSLIYSFFYSKKLLSITFATATFSLNGSESRGIVRDAWQSFLSSSEVHWKINYNVDKYFMHTPYKSTVSNLMFSNGSLSSSFQVGI